MAACVFIYAHLNCLGYPGIKDIKVLHKLGEDINVVQQTVLEEEQEM